MDAEYFIHPFPLRGLPLSQGKKTKTKTPAHFVPLRQGDEQAPKVRKAMEEVWK